MGLLSILILLIPSPSRAERLAYYSPKPEYVVEYSAKVVVLRTPAQTIKLTVNSCNRLLVERFWSAAKKNFAKFPAARGLPKSNFAELDGKRRLIFPNLDGDQLATVPEDFLTLVSQDQHQCKS